MLLRCIAIDDGAAQPNDVPGKDAREGLLISTLSVLIKDQDAQSLQPLAGTAVENQRL